MCRYKHPQVYNTGSETKRSNDKKINKPMIIISPESSLREVSPGVSSQSYWICTITVRRLFATFSIGCQYLRRLSLRSLFSRSTVSVVLALPTCVSVLDIAARSSLRSAERGDLFVPRTRTTKRKLSRRSFTVAAPVVWNSLSAHLRSPLISRGQFRAGLKTHLFKQAYSL